MKKKITGSQIPTPEFPDINFCQDPKSPNWISPKHRRLAWEAILFDKFEVDFKINEHDYSRDPVAELKRFLKKVDCEIEPNLRDGSMPY